MYKLDARSRKIAGRSDATTQTKDDATVGSIGKNTDSRVQLVFAQVHCWDGPSEFDEEIKFVLDVQELFCADDGFIEWHETRL
jgi:hypothetical protein